MNGREEKRRRRVEDKQQQQQKRRTVALLLLSISDDKRLRLDGTPEATNNAARVVSWHCYPAGVTCCLSRLTSQRVLLFTLARWPRRPP